MSEHLLKFLLSELSTVRLVCRAKHCGMVAEMPVEKLAAKQHGACPFCGQEFGSTALQEFGQQLLRVRELHQRGVVDLQFVLPADKQTP